MRVTISFNYGVTVTPAQVKQLAGILNVQVGDLVKEEADGQLTLNGWREYEGDLESIAAVGIPFQVKAEAQHTFLTYLLDELKKLQHGITGLSAKYETVQAKNPSGIVVHIPNHELYNVRECKVMENCCTDMLNAQLNHNWRILAICPQPNQRRPDYILGLLKEKEE